MNDAASNEHEFVADDADAGLRLDRFLAARMPDFSRNRLQALIRSGQVAKAGATICDPNSRVNRGDRIAVTVPPAEPAQPAAEEIPLDIVYEDDALLVIDKPAGLVVHPAAGNRTGTLVNALIAHCGDSLSGIGGVKRPGIVHRLDKETSGLMVVAKTDAAHRGLAGQFAAHGRDGQLERSYVAIAWGVPARASGEVCANLGRDPVNRRRRKVVANGKEAITAYRVMRDYGGVACRLECRLATGRTHQIRVHMAHIGHPLLGDELYGKGFRTRAAKLSAEARAALDALGRQALHAASLGFTHPTSGEDMRFERLVPADMQALIDALEAMAG